MTIHLYENDIPAHLVWGDCVAIDTEAMGLNPHRDRLCLVQLSTGDGVCHLVHFKQVDGRVSYDAPNLKKLLSDPKVTKLFHFARFDVAILAHYLGVTCSPIYCTKVASKLVRTFAGKHGLKELCKYFIGKDISKEEQTSDWGADVLSESQKKYAATDVLYLHKIKAGLEGMLAREGRTDLATACFEFIKHRAHMDLLGYDDLVTAY